MTPFEAQQILTEMEAELAPDRLFISENFCTVDIRQGLGNDLSATFIDGHFNRNQLEALTVWIQNPEAVVQAKDLQSLNVLDHLGGALESAGKALQAMTSSEDLTQWRESEELMVLFLTTKVLVRTLQKMSGTESSVLEDGQVQRAKTRADLDLMVSFYATGLKQLSQDFQKLL
jgi:hypothetical protein